MAREPVVSEAKRATIGLWVALAILGLAAVVAHETIAEVSGTTAWVAHSHEVIERLAAERAALAEAETVRRAYDLTSGDAWHALYADAIRAVDANGKAVRALTADNATQQRRLDEVEALLQKRASMFDAAVAKAGNAGATEAGAGETRAGQTTDDRLDSILADIASEELALLAARRHETALSVRFMQIVQVVGTVFSFAILLVAFRRMRRETTRRFVSEDAATEGEESLAKILLSIGDGVIATDLEGRLVRMNRVTEELTGWTAREVIGKPASDIFRVIDAETRAPIPDPVGCALRDRVSVELDRPRLLIRRDGSEVRVTSSCTLIRDGEGVVHGVVLVFRDVSEAQRAKTFFRALVEKSTDGIALTSPDGVFLYVSPAAARILGSTAEAALGTNVLDYAYPGDLVRVRQFTRELAARPGASADTERRVKRADGKLCWIEVTGTNLMEDPAVGAIVRNMRDITERKASEGALQASEAQFARLSESGLIGIAHADTLGNVHDANDAYLHMLGYSRTDLAAGRVGWATMTPPEWAIMSSDRANHGVQGTGVMAPSENELFRQDGSRIPVLMGAAMLDAMNCITFIVDLTDRKRAERTLRETEEQLRQSQKMDAVGRLAGGVAHDFNNMLSVILSYSTLMLDNLKPTDPMHADLDEIRKAGQRAADLTRQLLMFSRQQVIEPRVVDLNDVLSDMDKMLRRMLGEDIEVTLTRGATEKVLVDPSGIEQVVMNLVVNARDAMPTGGKLTIETADVVLDDEYARHHVGMSPGPHVMLAVTDSGTGIDAATRARIFEPFFTTKEKGKGTGLGLSTVFGLAAQSGGSVWVYSEVGLGTTFKVYLPRATTEVHGVEVAVAPATLRGTETVLLVEDEDQVRAVARGILTRAGYKVIEARNAGEALLSCEQHPGMIHLLLSDVVMPKMSGPELAKRLAAARPDMRVLCMSGYTDDSIVRHGVLEAHFAFLQKPITPQTLTRKVREVLEAPRAA